MNHNLVVSVEIRTKTNIYFYYYSFFYLFIYVLRGWGCDLLRLVLFDMTGVQPD